MKKAILIYIGTLVIGLAHAQKINDADVPTAVKSAFTKLFPSATGVKWSKEGAAEFEAEFKINAIKGSSNFDPAGKWLGTETEIKSTDLPPAVTATIASEFVGYTIGETEKAETPDKGMFYEVEMKKGASKVEAQITADGKLINKKEKEVKEKKESKDKDKNKDKDKKKN